MHVYDMTAEKYTVIIIQILRYFKIWVTFVILTVKTAQNPIVCEFNVLYVSLIIFLIEYFRFVYFMIF